jgi:hypothetical protein
MTPAPLPATVPLPTVEGGSRQLLAGVAGAFKTRSVIQQTLGVIKGRQDVPADPAYLLLRVG